MKICNKCKKGKNLTDFNKHSREKDGHDPTCRECIKVIRKKWDKKYTISDKFKESQKRFRKTEKRKEYIRLYMRQYIKTEKGKILVKRNNDSRHNKEWYKRWVKDHYENNRLSVIMSVRIRQSLNGNKNNAHWENLVDYTLRELREHLELLFKPEMTWENHTVNGWHIDHIKPISLFNITDYNCEDFKKCWSLNNLQPLWAEENMKKGAKYKSCQH